jgi:pimeloyl-ACP methyl ester carboxylesterase
MGVPAGLEDEVALADALGIFISYRREDSGYAGRMHDHLAASFGPQQVFVDVASIEPGDDFVRTIDSAISRCHSLVVVIGPRWGVGVDRSDEQGRVDFVRVEIETALARGLHIFPVLVQGAAMPAAAELPPSIAELGRRHAFELTDRQWRSDITTLVQALTTARDAPSSSIPVEAETKYARSGDIHIAYQVTGTSDLDLVYVGGWVTHLEITFEDAVGIHYRRRLSQFARTLWFDRRGMGLSDRVVGTPTLEERMDDIRAVMDAEDSQRAAIFGISEGGPLALLFAATYPERTRALVLLGSFARMSYASDYPWGHPPELFEEFSSLAQQRWGSGGLGKFFDPVAENNPKRREQWSRLERNAASPGDVAGIIRMVAQTDVRHVLPTIRVPTLVIHHSGDVVTPVEFGRFLASQIPAAEYLELPGHHNEADPGEADVVLDAMRDFLTSN